MPAGSGPQCIAVTAGSIAGPGTVVYALLELESAAPVI